MTRPITLVKLGGSAITDKSRPRAARLDVIGRLASEIADAVADGAGPIVLGHGSGSFGHPEALAHGLDRGATDDAQRRGASATQREARDLHRLVVVALQDAGLAPFSIAPGSAMTASGGEIATVDVVPLLTALDAGFLPVVYGDVLPDRRQGVAIGSTEMVFAALVPALAAEGRAVARAIWLGNTDGVLDARGRLIPHLRAAEAAAHAHAIGGAAGPDVTGGMAHRVETAVALARLGVDSVVANGDTPGILRGLMTTSVNHGTRVTP